VKPLLAPSILSFNHAELAPPVAELMRSGADWIHCDIMDGQFVPPITFGADMVKHLAKEANTPFEAHLMTLSPERHFDAFVQAGCERIIFHAEATMHAHRLVQTLHQQGVQAGIAINPGTPVEMVEPLLNLVDLVLIMTVNPGWGGQKFIADSLHKVRHLRQLRPQMQIEVDGGIDPETIRQALEAGANVFVTGSYLAQAPTIAEGLSKLRRACESK
jgi:ribulose-phosphate 3-epimerase